MGCPPGKEKPQHRTLIRLMDRLRNVMGLLLGTNAHMGHKYLHKHTMHMFTFGHTCTLAGIHAQVLTHTYKKEKKWKEKTAVASENNPSYQRKGILSYLSNTYLESFH